MTEGARTRAQAARAVADVVSHGRSLDKALAHCSADMAAPDRALMTLLAYGTLRHHRWLGELLGPRLRKKPQPLLDALLRVGLYQLELTRIPPHAAVHATVAATASLKLAKARGMVNAVLRGHQREPLFLTDDNPAVIHSYPDWLAKRIADDWGAAATEVLAAGNERAPMHVRINRRRGTRQDFSQHCLDSELGMEPTCYCDDGLTLAAAMAAERLPGFAEGHVSIQDGAAQLAADLMAPENGERILDACAAPGNKTAHLLERADIDLTALDVDARRLETLQANLHRLGLSAATRAADAGQPDTWWDGTPFDRILLDAPCSGTGVIRRHPDIKWLRRKQDIAAASRRQQQLLKALWPLLAPGGRLVYATCSILRAEGEDQIRQFLADTPDARHEDIRAPWGEAASFGRRIAPGQHGFDGFYYAILMRAE